MNRCTQLDEILHPHVPRQPLEPCWISRSKVKITWVYGRFSVCVMLQLPADGT